MVKARSRGAALIEVLLALVVLGAGVVAAVRAGATCARVLRVAEHEQARLFAVEAVLDSLMAADVVLPGALERAGAELRWSIHDRAGLPVLELTAHAPAADAPAADARAAGPARGFAVVLWPARDPTVE